MIADPLADRPREEVPYPWLDGKLAYASGLTLDTAKKMLDAAEADAKRQGVAVTIAISDSGGNLVALRRMDFAPLFSIQIATNKSITSVFGKLPSQYWQGVFTSGVLPCLPFHDKWSAFGGGFPLIRQDQLFGGVGVSGGVLANDLGVAHAALLAGGFDHREVEAAIEQALTN